MAVQVRHALKLCTLCVWLFDMTACGGPLEQIVANEADTSEALHQEATNAFPAVHITGVKATIEASTGNLVENGRTYPFIYKPVPLQPWVRRPWISPTQSFLGYPGIGLELLPAATPTGPVQFGTNDKANLTVGKAPLNQTSYFGFAVRLAVLGIPTAPLMLSQIWQGKPYGPPLALSIVGNNASFPCVIELRNNKTGGNPGAYPIKVPVGSCKPGSWHTFRIGLTPHYPGLPGSGKLVVWHNDMSKPIASWTGDIGYDPSRPVDVNGVPGKPQSELTPNWAFTVFYGPYRTTQKVRAQTFWTNIKLASTPEGADPTVR